MSKTTTGHPKGLYVLFATEMWERFSYYGMRAIFTLYMTKALLMDKALASNIYGSYTGLVYLTPLIGGYISDRYWGNRKSILIGGLMMALGQFSLFFSASMFQNAETSRLLMYAGLFMLILGNGFFKPNISTMVGQLYPKGDKRVDGAFTIFYMGINLGAFFSPLICGGLGDTGNPADFKYGFLAAGIGMIIGSITFEMFKHKYIVSDTGEPLGMPKKASDMKIVEGQEETIPSFKMSQVLTWVLIGIGLYFVFNYVVAFDVIGSVIFSAAIAVMGLIISDKSLKPVERQRVWVIFILAFFVIFFWSAFEQAGASLTFFAEEQTDRSMFGWQMPASWFQSFNPVGIIILAPLFTILWAKLGNRNNEPSSPFKMAFGLLFLCLGYIVIAIGVNNVAPGVKTGMFWLTSLYLLHTIGELCLSPIGLSMVSKLAPIRFASLLMGTWFLANATANKFAGTLSALYPPGQGEISAASAKGIDLPAILNKTQTPTSEQLATLSSSGIPSEWPTFLGNQITNLYDFFMIFIVMSAVASAILFLISKKLSKMMHGVN
jgi:proton-dependent oligopeptide transporter, POT family